MKEYLPIIQSINSSITGINKLVVKKCQLDQVDSSSLAHNKLFVDLTKTKYDMLPYIGGKNQNGLFFIIGKKSTKAPDHKPSESLGIFTGSVSCHANTHLALEVHFYLTI